MALFLSTFINKIDKKGRISVPAQFRPYLSDENFSGVILYESFINPSIEGCNIERIKKLSDAIDNLDPFCEDRDSFATTILAGSMQISMDADGRIILPDNLIAIADLKEKAIFVGKGKTFEIWQPEKFSNYMSSAKIKAKEKRNILRINNKDNNA
ncbi:cell division/cell wall cluster transcriptional repressor MraZ [Rickettsiales bacterium]|nr:cell division/cell wall cluster transcriptional repressor MraZ [Rickettsiales bacterium]